MHLRVLRAKTLNIVYYLVLSAQYMYRYTMCYTFQPSSHHLVLHVIFAPLTYCSFRYTGHSLHIGVFCVSGMYILEQCPRTRLSCNVKILKYGIKTSDIVDVLMDPKCQIRLLC